MEDHDAARDLAVGPANRRRGELRGELAIGLLAEQQRATPEVDALALAQAFRDGIAERAAIDLVDERQEIEQALAEPRAARAAEQLLGRFVHVVDRAVQIRRDDAFADRLERDPRLQLAASERRLEALTVRDVVRDGQERVLALELQPLAVQLDPQAALVAADELHLDRLQRLGGLEMIGDVLAHQRAVRGPQQIGDRLAGERRGIDTEQVAGGAVREQDRVRVDQRDLGQRVRERDEQARVGIGRRLGRGRRVPRRRGRATD